MGLPLPPTPKSALGFHRLLAPNTSVRVSPLCLGGMNFGEGWKDFMGECNQETAERILDLFSQNGGNFIDTANHYQKGDSEQLIGNWMKKRGNRDRMIIATKYTTPYSESFGDKELIINTGGNGSKSLHTSLEASLKKIQTSYIDLAFSQFCTPKLSSFLYVHWWDFTCSIPEMMQSLNSVVTSGKVLYLGISNTPAWVVSKANQYTRDHGFRQFSVYQGKWSAACRDLERDIIPMCISEGMGLAPWGVLGSGAFKSEEQRNSREGRKIDEVPESAIEASKVLERIAQKKHTAITSIALASVIHKTPYVFPIVGGRKIEHLEGNIAALSLGLSQEEIEEIEGAVPFDIGYPMNFLGRNEHESLLNKIGGHYEYVGHLKPIPPHKM
ncbi:hypothetical protein OIDMADRAFT_160769 [Oidiodendron maius Zn]|uniref:NADP-dependent oxidoreductase domain-containing protein n=1 Tax=Oidiodendron maius (strain Zn) TaxID=913774 RepID=A0A0C3HJG6_OIDMZ|nr:hypothetical protein OIDMADRAFT_160769 [Oidiodendron maius Zn]